MAHILVLDDDPDVGTSARLLLHRRYDSVQILRQPGALDAALASALPDVVLLDLNFTPAQTDGAEGMALLSRLLALPRPPAVIALTAYADVGLAVRALKRGATDFITKPWDNEQLVGAIDNALAQRKPRAGAPAPELDAMLLGQSDAMYKLKAMIANAAPTEANVLILGENGVGKELVAQAVHAKSHRAGGRFLPVDMGAIPETTFESELFGHVRGAFTDARSERQGRFQAAQGGTLFLDEIGNTPLSCQAKLLAALERRKVTPVGADQSETIDVRIVSATNLAELDLFDPARFRRDLLFRLNTVVIRVPPLRERRDDVPLLLRHFLEAYQRQYQRPARMLDSETLERLCRYDWPGNIRSLRHACERAVIFAARPSYHYDDFGLIDVALLAEPQAAEQAPATLGHLERDAIRAALDKSGGNITRAAKLLGVSRTALYRKLDKHGL